jgi:hypothetical protein
VTEWRLFEEDTIPEFTTSEFFAAHPWIEPVHQIGHTERTDMVAEVIDDLCEFHLVRSFLDLGCGDGSLLRRISECRPDTKLRGITASADDAMHAYAYGLDGVEVGDFMRRQIYWEEVTVMTEVLEHLLDPHAFLKTIKSEYLVASSPSAETDTWHYEHHAWAWDLDGYRKLIEDAGWKMLTQRECSSAKSYDHGTGLFQPLRFQVIVAERT